MLVSYRKFLASIYLLPLFLGSYVFLTPSPSLASVSSQFPAGINSYWKHDESSGVRYAASSSNDLSDVNGVGSVAGKILFASDFESSSSTALSISDASQSGLDGLQKFFIGTWFTPESLPTSGNYVVVVKKDSSTSRSYSLLYVNNGGTYQFWFYVFGNSGGSAFTNVDWDYTLSVGTPYYIGVSFDGSLSGATSKINLSVNASAVSSSFSTEVGGGASSMANSTAAFEIGRDSYTGSNYADGWVDETIFLNYVPATSTISALYNSGVGLPWADGVSTSTLPFPPTTY